MQQAVLDLFPEVVVKYRFTNRGVQRFTDRFLTELDYQIYKCLPELRLTEDEYLWLSNNIPYFKPQFLAYLKNYRFDPSEISHLSLDGENNLKLEISGSWHSTILWEVVLMALISEIYFRIVETDWNNSGQEEKAHKKLRRLSENSCIFADFGTRRRRSYKAQDIVNHRFAWRPGNDLAYRSTYVGTSNVHFARKYNTKPIGTMSHEWIMGNSVLEGLRNANYYALQNWVRVYNTDLGIALTDTYGLDSFFRNFNKRLATLYSGVRQDSGNPFEFIPRVIEHYESHGIDPTHKSIVFSDGLDTDTAIELKRKCEHCINCSFGIGTHFTNDFVDCMGDKSSPLNMVIKMWECNGIPVVKLGEGGGKVMGDPQAVAVARWVFQGTDVTPIYDWEK
tara:strand:- start:3673 stop:4851 length:1179 start_codon:yes stop_codon:yes gene_type:complete